MKPLKPVTEARPNARRAEPAAATVIAVTIPDAARLTGLSRSRIYTLLGDGRLPLVKLGGSSLVPYRALAELIAKHIAPMPPQAQERARRARAGRLGDAA